MKTKNWAIALFSATIAVALSISTVLAEVIEVTATLLKVHSGPGLEYSTITTLSRGTRVDKSNQEGAWAYIAAGRVKGWVFIPFTKIVGSVPGPGPGTGGGSGGGTIGPLPSRYQSSGKLSDGKINNARYSGAGSANAQIVEPYGVVVNVVADGRLNPFSVTYYGDVIARSDTKITVNVTGFASTLTKNKRLPKNGSCEIAVIPNGKVLKSLTCTANSGLDHGKTVFTGP